MSAPVPLISHVLHVGSDPAFGAKVESAARAIGADVVCPRVATLDEALARPVALREVVVLSEPAAGSRERALDAVDAGGLPRWGVAVGRPDDAPDTIARLIAAAAREHELRWENARLRGDLATIGVRVTHDLRTPLGGVLTTTEMLREVLGDDAPKDVPLVQPIIESTESLVELIQRVSFFVKANAAREPLQALNLATPFWNAFQHLEARIAKAGAALAQPKDWPEARGHAGWIEVVWRNLVANALKHGGAAVRMEAGWERSGPEVRCWLRDRGSIAPEKRGALFFPFERLHEPGAPRGLGLPIARRLVELQGGRCGYEARANGSEFWFTLPAAGAVSASG
ncbi:MAG TPA: HAMP domain-containing sensor histidine kinase [Opitutus sp.]|nr:HAMP domain-containing sensor histidine kinase [Opitutus sp.]